LPPMSDDLPRNRLGLAQWLVSNDHPLTARVQVNKMWQHFFGKGLVKTAEDFGVQSEYPTHGALLDWLAVEFIQSGWKMKELNRLIATSSTYRQSSQMSEELRARDFENRLYARASRIRMPSMVLRDWALAASDLIDERIGGAPVYPYQPDQVWEALAITKERDFTYPASHGRDLYRRSLYTFWRRTVAPTNMFDTANRQTCKVTQAITSSPLHALTTLNDPTWVEAARNLAQRILIQETSIDSQLAGGFYRVVCRRPTEPELTVLQASYDKQHAIFANDIESAKQLLSIGESQRDETLDATQHAAMTNVCLMILNLDESLTRE
jgi:hypothetical protein